ncbi:hypothetical protein LNKW23_14420 [Paralimibaculum aggregatum]|uniref:Uncharacterized protein n=1 Tax=Paralimibaculum aggregatum TaxID=3036245 RepID=A0ABQ6LNM8_9RHOB|nr:hypothetical protein LNKW23_14420 [Limibaculum sp. NKW23]
MPSISCAPELIHSFILTPEGPWTKMPFIRNPILEGGDGNGDQDGEQERKDWPVRFEPEGQVGAGDDVQADRENEEGLQVGLPLSIATCTWARPDTGLRPFLRGRAMR